MHWTDQPKQSLSMASSAFTALSVIEKIAISVLSGDPVRDREAFRSILALIGTIRSGVAGGLHPDDVESEIKLFATKLTPSTVDDKFEK